MFNVQLTVTDNRGGTSTASKAINVRSGDVGAFTLLWSTAVASADALCTASVVAASDMGYIYAVSGDGKMVALNTDGAKVWEYDAMAKDGVYLKSEISYPSVDTDGTVYWVGHGYGGTSSASVAYAFDGATGSVLWKNTTAYAPAARIAFSTPCISPSMVIVGSRGTNGAIRGFEKSTGKNTATATPATDSEATAAPALKIAYIDADSIMSAYTLAKEIAEEGQRLMNNYNRQEQSKQQEIQKFGNNIEQKRQNNVYLSEASFQADVEKLQKMQNDAARHLTNQQNQIQNTIAQAQARLNDSIMNAVNAYNATKGYDAILLRESGVYFNPELNVTADIIEVLNSRYTAAAK